MATPENYEVPHELITDPFSILKHLQKISTDVTFRPVLIGSRALHHHLPQYRHEEFIEKYAQKDYDLIVDVATALQIMPKEKEFTRRYNRYRYDRDRYNYQNRREEPEYFIDGPPGFYAAKLTIFQVPSQVKTLSVVKQAINPQDAGKTFTIGSRVYPAIIRYHNVTIETFTEKIVNKYKLFISCDGGSLDMEVVTNPEESGYLIATASQHQPVIAKSVYKDEGITIVAHVASIDMLEAIKTSHIYHPINFTKHIIDLHIIRRCLGLLLDQRATIRYPLDAIVDINSRQPGLCPDRSPELNTILEIRRKELNLIKGVPGAHINLKKTNDEFLETEGTLLVEKMIKHDDIHEMVMFGVVPMYTELKEDQSQATCLQPLFEALTYTQKCQCVMEEAMVLALERYLLPEYERHQQRAYSLALTRVCTTITKGWFRLFAINNWPALSECPRPIKDFAYTIIGKYQAAKDAEQALNPAVPLPDLQKYFNDDELELVAAIVSNLEEIFVNPQDDVDTEIEVTPPKVGDATPEAQVTPTTSPLKKWKNNGRHQHTKTNLDGYEGDYDHHNRTYDFPATERIFRLRKTNTDVPEVWIKIVTDHSFHCADCSESLSWTGSVTLTPPGLSQKESLRRLESTNYNLLYDKETRHYLQLDIDSYCSKGGSDGNDTGTNIKVEEHGTFQYPATLLRVIFGLINPHMLPAGESLLGSQLAYHTHTYNFPSGQHPWFEAYMSKLHK